MQIIRKNVVQFQILGIFLLGFLIYADTFNSSFHFDDWKNIVGNPDLQKPLSFETLKLASIGQISRIVSYLTFFVNFKIHELSLFGYHLVNTLIHIMTTLGIWWFVELILKTPKVKEGEALRKFLPFMTALLFLAHPVQTQAVTYISQRMESLATMFYVYSVCFYLKGRLQDGIFSRKIFLFFFSFVAAFLGMFTKETTFTVPIMIIFSEFMFFGFEGKRLREEKQLHWLKFLPFLGILLFLFVIPYFYQNTFQGFLTSTLDSESHDGDILTFKTYVLTQFRVAIKLLGLFLLPISQNIDHDFSMSQNLWDPLSTAGSLALLLLLIGVAIWIKNRHVLISYGILWYVITLSVNFIPRENVMFEHKLYLTSIGLCLAFNVAISSFLKEKYYYILMSVVIVVLSLTTINRNKVWEDELSLWSDSLEKSPHKARPRLNVGVVYLRQGAQELALSHFNAAISADPKMAEAYNNRGMIYYLRQDYNNALKDFYKSLILQPRNYSAYLNIGNIHLVRGKLPQAVYGYNHAISVNATPVEAYNNRGSTYFKQGKIQLALDDFNKAIALSPDFFEAYVNRGDVYVELKDYKSALEDYDKALNINPKSEVVLARRQSVLAIYK